MYLDFNIFKEMIIEIFFIKKTNNKLTTQTKNKVQKLKYYLNKKKNSKTEKKINETKKFPYFFKKNENHTKEIKRKCVQISKMERKKISRGLKFEFSLCLKKYSIQIYICIVIVNTIK